MVHQGFTGGSPLAAVSGPNVQYPMSAHAASADWIMCGALFRHLGGQRHCRGSIACGGTRQLRSCWPLLRQQADGSCMSPCFG